MAKDPKKKEQKNNFLKDVNSELKKVTWPTGKELFNSTATVLLITITIAIIVFVLDFAFEKANTYGVDKLKSVVSSSQEENPNNGEEVVDDQNADETTEVTSEEATQDAESTETSDAEATQDAETTEEVAQ